MGTLIIRIKDLKAKFHKGNILPAANLEKDITTFQFKYSGDLNYIKLGIQMVMVIQ